MYKVPASPEERPGCRDALAITRAVFGVILPPVAAMLALLLMMALALVAFAVTPLLALVPVAVVVAGIVLYARWEHRRMGEGPNRR